MRIAFLNLCHTDPQVVARVAMKLTAHPDMDMYIHVDAKSDIEPFIKAFEERDIHPSNPDSRIHLIGKRVPVYWGGYNAIEATANLIEAALVSYRNYDYLVTLQNLDYPIKSNQEIMDFFKENEGTEFIRGCNIARTKDAHYMKKYRLYYDRDKELYLKERSVVQKILRSSYLAIKGLPRYFFNGIIREGGETFKIHYGAAQWAITAECARYIMAFKNHHPRFNRVMRHIQFPDEEYFHTIVHNSEFKYRCSHYDEPPKRWLVNWRNLHYFEFPFAVTVMEDKDYEKIMQQDALFVRKVKSGVSDQLMYKIDHATQ